MSLLCLSTSTWGQVKDNQGDDVMFLGIKMVDMARKVNIEERSAGEVVLRQLNQLKCILKKNERKMCGHCVHLEVHLLCQWCVSRSLLCCWTCMMCADAHREAPYAV